MFEEVDRVVPGGNYGWPIMEANLCVEPPCDKTGLLPPIAQYPRELGTSVVGGYVYRGSSIPGFEGQYIFVDVYAGTVWSIAQDAEPGVEPMALFQTSGIAAMGEGNDGELYFLSLGAKDPGGSILRLGGDGASVVMPANLSDTGCFDTNTKAHPSGVVEYEVNSALWSDGAEKRRAFALLDDRTIGVLKDGDFAFPDQSVLVKHFLSGEDYLETRLFVRHPQPLGWTGYSYQWNEAQTDATLVAGDEEIAIDAGPFTHTIPTRGQCLTCHTQAATYSLGPEAIQLNRYSETFGQNTLDALESAGYFTTEVSSASQGALVGLSDAGSVDERARSYLHSNCAGCHRPGGSRVENMDLRYGLALSATGTCNMPPEFGDLGVQGSQRIAPSNADASVLVLRMQALDENRMPQIGTHVVHQEAVTLIREWINAMQGCD